MDFAEQRKDTEPQGTNKAAEWRWVLIFAALTVLITSLPYWLGYHNQGEQWRFTGFVFGLEDGNSYIAKMLSGSAGAWLFRTPYSGVVQKGVLAFLPYILLGKLVSQPDLHQKLVILFQLYRMTAAFLDILATYAFISLFIGKTNIRRIALTVCIFGGGLGWILSQFYRTGTWLEAMPLDYYSPETFGFLSIFGLPHLALARACLLWGFWLYLRPVQPNPVGWLEKNLPLVGGVTWLVLGLAQPITLVVAWCVMGLHLGVCLALSRVKGSSFIDLGDWKQYLSRGFWIALISSPIVVYTAVKFVTDPFLIAWSEKNLITSPTPIQYVFAYGLLLPLAVAGAVYLWKSETWKSCFLVGWFASFPILAYAPVNVQRRLVEGIWVVIVILAAVVLDRTAERKRIWILPFFALTLPSTIIFMINSFGVVSRPAAPLFLPAAETRAFEFLSETAPVNSVVLTSYTVGNNLPAWAPVRVLSGHGPEGVGSEAATAFWDDFLEGKLSENEVLDFLEKQKVQYVMLSPEDEQSLSWSIEQTNYLKQIYLDAGFMIFEVNLTS